MKREWEETELTVSIFSAVLIKKFENKSDSFFSYKITPTRKAPVSKRWRAISCGISETEEEQICAAKEIEGSIMAEKHPFETRCRFCYQMSVTFVLRWWLLLLPEAKTEEQRMWPKSQAWICLINSFIRLVGQTLLSHLFRRMCGFFLGRTTTF